MIATTAFAFLSILALAWSVVRAPRRFRCVLVPLSVLLAGGIVAAVGYAGSQLEVFDPLKVLAFFCALSVTGAALFLMRLGRQSAAVALLLLAGFILRADLAGRLWLAPWDERYHALVARNMLKHPLRPTLVDRPLWDRPPESWTDSSVWLHKPPMTMWLMAGSMSLFGRNEIALRIPSLMFGTAGILVTFLLVRRFVSPWGGFLGATFHAWHSRGSQLAAGLQATDHVDNLFIFLVSLGLLASVWAADALVKRRARSWIRVCAAGAVLGAALLTKGAPSLIIPAFFFMVLLSMRARWTVLLGAPALATVIGVAVYAPWQAYTASAFPEAFAYQARIAHTYFVKAVDGHLEAWYWHLMNIPRFFGNLTFIPIIAFFWHAVRKRRDWLPLVATFVLVYAVFSIAATKMKCYVFIASPVIWCALGWFSEVSILPAARRQVPKLRPPALLGFMVVGAYFLGAFSGAFDIRDARPRNPTWAQELRYLAGEVEKLPPGKWAVFNVSAHTEAMFYVDATCAPNLPTLGQISYAKDKGFDVAVYSPPIGYDPGAPGQALSVTVIPPDGRALPLRRLADELKKLGIERVAVYNAKHAAELKAYLGKVLDADVYPGMPSRNRKVLKQLRRGATVVVLSARKDERFDDLRTEIPEAIVLTDPVYGK